MRRRLRSQALVTRFRAAWNCLPSDVRGRIQPAVRQIREVALLEGSFIRCPDGRYGPLQAGNAFAFVFQSGNGSGVFCDVLLHSRLAVERAPVTMAVILHELAHVLCYVDRLAWTKRASIYKQEDAAWMLAGHWVSRPCNGLRSRTRVAMQSVVLNRTLEITVRELARQVLKAPRKAKGLPNGTD